MAKAYDAFMGIVELAKAGYKPNEVKDLLETITTQPDNAAGANDLNNSNPSDPKPEDKKPEDNQPGNNPDEKAAFDFLKGIIERNSKGD